MSENATYFVKGRRLRRDDPLLQSALQSIYGSWERPRCMCVQGGVEMYVAKLQTFVLKRMPGTGPSHAPECDHYDPPASDSGLGSLLGDALVESDTNGVQMFVDFPLTRRRGRAVEAVSGETTAEARAVRHQMSLRAVTHYLLDQAGFNRWSPAMEGKRNQAVFRKFMLGAAEGVTIKNGPLVERLYIPEHYRPEDRIGIRQRRRAQLAVLERPGTPDQFPMALVIGEFKSADEDPLGFRLFLKHMPDAPIMVDTKLWNKTIKKFQSLFLARQADGVPPCRLLLTAVIYSPQPHCYQADAIYIYLATNHWIPVCDPSELPLFEYLIEQRRRFIKPLSYDAKEIAGFANALLLDTHAPPTPLHLISPYSAPKDRDTKERLVSELDGGWIWRTEAPLPQLPPAKTRYAGNPVTEYPSRSTP